MCWIKHKQNVLVSLLEMRKVYDLVDNPRIRVKIGIFYSLFIFIQIVNYNN